MSNTRKRQAKKIEWIVTEVQSDCGQYLVGKRECAPAGFVVLFRDGGEWPEIDLCPTREKAQAAAEKHKRKK